MGQQHVVSRQGSSADIISQTWRLHQLGGCQQHIAISLLLSRLFQIAVVLLLPARLQGVDQAPQNPEAS
jgi:hypothetical protein